MIAASRPRPEPAEDRLLVVNPTHDSLEDARVGDLPRYLRQGDVVVVNDAATLPASFRIDGRDAEIRLLSRGEDDRTHLAVLFGGGDFRTPTERRPPPPVYAPGTELGLGGDLRATVLSVDDRSPRLVTIRFDRDGAALYQAWFRHGRPVQYAHVPEPLAVWDVQNRFAARPWAVEAPSAGRPLTWKTLAALRERGASLTSITHAAGLSSTGDDVLDRLLPVPERYSVSAEARDVIRDAKARGGRVLAIGTTVVRALEASAREHGELESGDGIASLLVGPGFVPRVVTGIFSGMHAPGTSHFSLLQAFSPKALLERALRHAEDAGYLEHEFGDSCLILRD